LPQDAFLSFSLLEFLEFHGIPWGNWDDDHLDSQEEHEDVSKSSWQMTNMIKK